ncbi:hypothetical protein NDU88_006053 [Pleurodeles waltl]|uniref:Uncharacterized protein n=1 Tax=Pleurodeles waltl TaxID=8319 RepID=A0AAV7VPQ5_PLEWA|nr:hypothetical protein NDU88_006053 [Pleurodeles waltl]
MKGKLSENSRKGIGDSPHDTLHLPLGGSSFYDRVFCVYTTNIVCRTGSVFIYKWKIFQRSFDILKWKELYFKKLDCGEE